MAGSELPQSSYLRATLHSRGTISLRKAATAYVLALAAICGTVNNKYIC